MPANGQLAPDDRRRWSLAFGRRQLTDKVMGAARADRCSLPAKCVPMRKLAASFMIGTERSRSRTSARLVSDLAPHVPGRALSGGGDV